MQNLEYNNSVRQYIMTTRWTTAQLKTLQSYGWTQPFSDSKTLYFSDSSHVFHLRRSDYDGRIFFEEHTGDSFIKHVLHSFEELLEFLSYLKSVAAFNPLHV